MFKIKIIAVLDHMKLFIMVEKTNMVDMYEK